MIQKKNTEEEYWLALLHAPGVGPVNFVRLIEHFGGPRNVFEAKRSEWQALNMKEDLRKYLQNPDWQAVEKDMQWLTQENSHLLTLYHPEYPPILRKIDDPPPLLFVYGDYTLLSAQQLAMVGTRHPSREGEQTAKEFAKYLSYQGLTITSGMALGIDGASHWGALAGTGKTIAIAGTGLDRIYPAKHRDLAYKILETGALVSELPIGTPVQRHHFPIRSRIVSGLSLGTLVIEAPEKSGALYTAHHAAKQGREVFAIPGSIHNPLVRGCHQLIKQGAKLVETAADILEELQIYRPFTQEVLVPSANSSVTDEKVHSSVATNPEESKPLTFPQQQKQEINNKEINKDEEINDLDSDYLRLLELVVTPSSIDDLVEQSGFTAGEVSSMLLILELRGLVTVQVGGLYRRTN